MLDNFRGTIAVIKGHAEAGRWDEALKELNTDNYYPPEADVNPDKIQPVVKHQLMLREEEVPRIMERISVSFCS